MARHILDRRPETRDDRFGARIRSGRAGAVAPVAAETGGGATAEVGPVTRTLLRQPRALPEPGQRTRAFLRIARGTTT